MRIASLAVLIAALGLATAAQATPDFTGVWQPESAPKALLTVDGKAPPLLPAAQKLYQDDVQSVAQAQDDATSFPWVATVLMIALIVVLVITQRYLRQRTNRMFNVGLLVASGAVVLVVLWSAVGLITETVYVDGGQSSGTRQAQQLAQARIEASQARTDELLALVARGGVDYGSEFTKLANDIGGKDGTGGLLGQARRDPADDTMAGQLDKAIANANT